MLSYALNVVDECVVEVRHFNGYWPMPCAACMQDKCKTSNAYQQYCKKAAG